MPSTHLVANMGQLNLYFMLLLVLGYFSCTSMGRVTLKPALGVAFVEESKTLRPWAGSQQLTFVIKLPRLKKLAKMRVPYTTCTPSTSMFDKMCVEGQREITLLVEITNELIENANLELQVLKKALKTLKLKSNNKRSLIQAGSFFQGLFGTADVAYVDKLYEQLKQVHKNVEEASEDRQTLFNAMHEMQDEDLGKFDTVFHLINNTNRFLTVAVQNLTATNEKLDAIYKVVVNPNSFTQLHALHLQHAAILSKHGYLRDLIRMYSDFHKDIYVLMAGKLPSSMVPASQLLPGLAKLKKAALKSSNSFIPLDSPESLHLYYEGATFTHAVVMGDSIMISIAVPYLSNTRTFDAYKIIVRKNPVHSNKQHAQNAYTVLTDAAEYLIVDKHRETYKLMSTIEFYECAHFNFGLCKSLTVTSPRQKHTCVWSIFRDEPNIFKQCEFKTFLQNQMEPDILPIEPNQYLVSGEVGDIALDCDSGTHFVHVSNLSLITPTCNCIWDTPNFIVNPRISECKYKTNLKPTVSHPVSLPIMHAFNMTQHMTIPRTNSVANQTPSVPIPDLNELGNGVHDIIKFNGIKTSE